MKTLQKILLCTLSGLLAAGRPAAQEAWSLERCLDYAAVHSLGLREQEETIGQLRTDLLQKRAALLPAVHLAVGQDWNWGRSVDMQELVIIRNKLTQATAVSVNATWNLFDGFSREYGRLAARSSLEAATYQEQQMREALRIDVTRAYLQLLLARQMSRYAAENYATIVRQKERTAQLVDAGSQPRSALYEMEAQVAADRSSMVEAECAVRSAAQALMQLMNLPYDASFTIDDGFGEDPVRERIPLVTAAQVDDWTARDPRLLRANALVSEKQHQLSAARSGFLPAVNLTAGYGTYYSSSGEETFRKQLAENRNPSVGVSVVIPVFNGLQAVSALRTGRSRLRLAELGAEQVRQDIDGEIRSCAVEAENCRQKYLSAGETVQAMKSLLDVTEAKYGLGASTALDYLVARNNHYKAVSDYLRAKWQYLFQIQLLERYRL